jgi:3-(3-hydroxy-phenyl)propionate hydroxylase
MLLGDRGANSGVQDTDNLAWKLRLPVNGDAPHTLLDPYASEREYAADENILNSTRATDIITPQARGLAPVPRCGAQAREDCAFARRRANSGRLSVPAVLRHSTLNTPDRDGDAFSSAMVPGAPCVDAPVQVDGRDAWLLAQTHGGAFSGLYFCRLGHGPEACVRSIGALTGGPLPARALIAVPRGSAGEVEGAPVVEDVEGMVAHRFDAQPGSFYLLRPDQHVCARWRGFDAAAVTAALKRATCSG